MTTLTPLKTKRRFNQLECLEARSCPAVVSFGANPQHTGISLVASQSLDVIHWSATVDNYFNSSFGHYGAPVVTDANTVIFSYKTGTTPPGMHIQARNGNDGSLIWDQANDWTPSPSNGWYPPYQVVLATATNRVYYAGPGGTIYYRTNPDSPTGTVGQLAFFGSLSDYQTDQATYDANVFVDTPLTVDNSGNIYFGFLVTGSTPTNLQSGIARIGADGAGSWVSARDAALGDTNIDYAVRNSTIALSNSGGTIYLGVRSGSTDIYNRLVGLNSTTLATQFLSGVLKDPRDGGVNNAYEINLSTASPMVGPDGRVFFGVLGNPNSGFRGWMLQFSGDLNMEFTPGGFGWDNTASIVPASMVPQYTGTSSYLIFTKYNNYYLDDGDGSNKIAILDPNDSEPDDHTSSDGQLIMKRILYKVGPTPDLAYPGVPTAVREWCINDAAVDPATQSVLVNSEDGYFYRWYLPTNTLSQAIQLTSGIGEPYTPTVVGVDGTMYGQEDGLLYALGQTPHLAVADVSVPYGSNSATFTVSLDYPRTVPITVNYATADGSATAPTNYTTTSGMLTFNPGVKTQTVVVPVVANSVMTGSANFYLNLSSPSNALIGDGQGQATLLGRPPRVQSVAVNGNAAQRSRVTSITVAFDQIVSLPMMAQNAFQLVRQSDSMPVILSAAVDNTGPGTVVTLSFTGGPVEFGSLADGRYTLKVLASQVSGGYFDGNGDNTPGDDYMLVGTPANGLFRLFGDSDGNGTVNAADFLAFRSAFGGSSNIFDFDNNSAVGATDFLAFRSRFGGGI